MLTKYNVMVGTEDDPEEREHPTAGGPAPRLADDRFYRSLTAPRRRRLLYYLLGNGESTVDELASVLSGWEATTAGTMQTAADRSRIRLQLRHSHVPRLDKAGLVDYDADAGSVRLEPLHPEVADVIRRSIEAEQLAGTDTE